MKNKNLYRLLPYFFTFLILFLYKNLVFSQTENIDKYVIEQINQFKNEKKNDSLIIFINNFISVNAELSQEAYLHQELALAYLEFGNINFAEKEFLLTEKNYQKQNKKELRAEILLQLVSLYLRTGRYSHAENTLNEALLIIDPKKQNNLYAHAISYQGAIFSNYGNYEQAFRAHFTALSYARLANDSFLIAQNYKDIGNGYYGFKNYILAENYYRNALDIYAKIKNNTGIAIIYNNLGEINRSMQNFDAAIRFHKLAAKNDSIAANTDGLTYDYLNLTEDYILSKKIDSAQIFYELTLWYANEIANYTVKALAYNLKATILIQENQLKAAENFLLQAEEIGLRNQAVDIKLKTYQNLEKLYILKQNFEKAHVYSNRKYEVFLENNSSSTMKRITSLEHLESEIKMEIENLNESNSLVKKAFEKQKAYMILTIGLLFISIVLVVFIYRLYKSVLKKNSLLAKQNKFIADAENNLQIVNKELIASVKKFQKIVELLPILVYGRNEKGNIVFWNKEAEKLSGYNAKEMGKNENSLDLLVRNPDELDSLKKALDRGKFNWIETDLTTKDGNIERIAWSNVVELSPITDWKDWGIGINISGRYKFEKYLERERALLNSIINSIPYMIFYKNIQGVYLGANPAFKKFFGIETEVIGKKDNDIFSSKEALQFEHIERIIIQEKTTYSEEKWTTGIDGNKFLIHTLKLPFINSQGIVLGIVGISRDTTERYEFEQELQKQKEKAEDSDNLKSAFLANMSHEIRTPLNAIIGFADLLKNINLTGEQREKYVEYINNSGNNLLNLIDDIIDTAKIEAGQLKIRKGKVYINRLLEEILATHFEIKNKAHKDQVEIRLIKQFDDKNTDIYTDANRLRQILSNLINNAIKFVDQGYIEFGYKQQGRNLIFHVEDTGIGIAQDKHELIFERFGQVESTYKKNFQGTGLGLAITKKLVILLGGKIWLQSEENKGTTFFFTLPFVHSKIEEDEVILSNDFSQYSFSNKTILVAEDDRLNYIVLKNTLAKTQAKLIWKHNGKEVVEHIKNKLPADLIIMDIQMPEMNGYEATQSIREFNSKIPIIALTAYALLGEREKIINAGCNEYLTKPFKAEQLLKTLATFILNQKEYE